MDLNIEIERWRPYSWHCPNCGHIVTGYRNDDGTIKMECGVCHILTVRKILSRRHDRFDVYASEEQTNNSEPEELPFY